MNKNTDLFQRSKKIYELSECTLPKTIIEFYDKYFNDYKKTAASDALVFLKKSRNDILSALENYKVNSSSHKSTRFDPNLFPKNFTVIFLIKQQMPNDVTKLISAITHQNHGQFIQYSKHLKKTKDYLNSLIVLQTNQDKNLAEIMVCLTDIYASLELKDNKKTLDKTVEANVFEQTNLPSQIATPELIAPALPTTKKPNDKPQYLMTPIALAETIVSGFMRTGTVSNGLIDHLNFTMEKMKAKSFNDYQADFSELFSREIAGAFFSSLISVGKLHELHPHVEVLLNAQRSLWYALTQFYHFSIWRLNFITRDIDNVPYVLALILLPLTIINTPSKVVTDFVSSFNTNNNALTPVKFITELTTALVNYSTAFNTMLRNVPHPYLGHMQRGMFNYYQPNPQYYPSQRHAQLNRQYNAGGFNY